MALTKAIQAVFEGSPVSSLYQPVAAEVTTLITELMNGANGLGYATGQGSAVTQITSRTTGVTLTTWTGKITMFSAAGSTTAATFTVTNANVEADDVVIVCQKSGTNKYNLLVTAVAAGSFDITFYTTGGTATDAPVINFAIFRAASA